MKQRRIAIALALLAAPVSAQQHPARMTAPDDAVLRVAARRVTDPPAPPPVLAPPVRLRLTPEVREDAGLRAAVAALGGAAVVAEPADYELATPADYPETLMLQPVRYDTEPVGEREEVARMGAAPVELGNLMLDDYAPALAAAMRRITWTRALISLGEARPATTVCHSEVPDDPGATRCTVAGRFVGIGDRPLPITSSRLRYFAVRNGAAAPRYLYLVDVDEDYRVTPIALERGGPVAPGGWAFSAGDFVNPRDHVLVAIASERPLPDGLLSGPDWLAADPRRCDGPVAVRLCGRTGADPSASVAAVHDFVPRIAVGRIGGGMDAGRAMARWMAEFYSTIPYTKAEFAADDAKPAAEKEYLRARAGPGLYHRCGGSLIAPDLMVTAAHCVAKGGFADDGAVRVFRERRVRTGSQMLGSGGTTYAIDAMVVHAGYRPGQQSDDIALIRLKADRAALGAVPPSFTVSLPRPADRLAAAAPLTAFGWGFTGQVAPGARALVDTAGQVQRNPDRLQYGELQTMGWDTCRQRVGALLDGGMLCAETDRRARLLRPGLSVFSCVGDSGGPLVQERAGGDVLFGIASWSKGCGYGDNPSVYTNVARFLPWIAQARARMTPGAVVYLDAKGGARTVRPPAQAQ